MPNPSTHFLPIFNHSSEVDEASKHGSSAVDGQIEIWFLLLQYACTGGEFLSKDYGVLGYLHWLG